MENKNLKHGFTQVAGHTSYGEFNVPCIMISDDGLRVLKLIQQPPRGQKELIFYRQINGGFSNFKKQIIFSDSGVNSSSRRLSHVSYKFDSEYLGSESSYSSSTVSNLSYVQKIQNHDNSSSSSSVMQSLNENLLSEFNIDEKLLKKLRDEFVAKFYGVKTVNGYDYLELERIGYHLRLVFKITRISKFKNCQKLNSSCREILSTFLWR